MTDEVPQFFSIERVAEILGSQLLSRYAHPAVLADGTKPKFRLLAEEMLKALGKCPDKHISEKASFLSGYLTAIQDTVEDGFRFIAPDPVTNAQEIIEFIPGVTKLVPATEPTVLPEPHENLIEGGG